MFIFNIFFIESLYLCYIFAVHMYKTYLSYILYGTILLFLFKVGPVWGEESETKALLPYKSHVPRAVLEELFDSAEVYSNMIRDYRCDLYLKGHLHVHKANKIIKFVPYMFKLEKGVNDYVYESLSKYHYTAPDIYDRKVQAVSSTFKVSNSRMFDIIDYMRFNIYSPSMMGDKLLSPLSRKASSHYYYMVDSVEQSADGQLLLMHVIPRYRSTQLIESRMWVSTSDWSVRYINITGKYGLVGFDISMTMGRDECRLLPSLIDLTLDFKFMRNHLEMEYTGWMKYDSVNMVQPGESIEKFSRIKDECNLSASYSLTCDTSTLIVDREQFNRIRPLPLDEDEESLYMRANEKKRKGEEQALKIAHTRQKRNQVLWGQLGEALINSYNIDLSRVGTIKCSPLINPFLLSYSHSKGLSYRQQFKYNKLFHNGKLLKITPQVGYNFTKKELYAMADCEYVYNPLKNASINFQIGNGNRIYSSVVLDKLKEIPDSLFSFDDVDLDYFKDVNMSLSHSIEITNGLKLWTGVSIHWRYTKSTPEVEARVRTSYNSFAPRVRLEYTPGMCYYINGNRKINVGSRYPTFVVDMEKGMKIFKHCGRYDRLEMSIGQLIPLKNVRSLAYHVGGGIFSRQSDMYFVDFVDFSHTNLPQGWNDDIGGSFQMLDNRWYNSSRHYLRANVTYEAPFLLLYPMNKMLSFIQKERIYGGIVFMPHLNPYFEMGYGVATHLFDVGVFMGNEMGKFTSVGFKFTFELFND